MPPHENSRAISHIGTIAQGQIFDIIGAMKTSARCATFLLATFLGGCVTSDFIKAPESKTYPRVQMEDVKVFWTEGSAPPHEVLGRLTVRGDAIMLKKDDLFMAFVRRKAGELGANGVIRDTGHDPGTAARAVSEVMPIPGLVRREKTVIAIRYKEVE